MHCFIYAPPDRLSGDDVVDCNPRLTSLFVQGVDQEEPEITVTWKVGIDSSNKCGNTSYVLRLETCGTNETFCNETVMNTSHADVFLRTHCPQLSHHLLLATIEMDLELPYNFFLIHDLVDTRKYCVIVFLV